MVRLRPRLSWPIRQLKCISQVLQIMDDDNLTECFEEPQPDGSYLEHLF